MARISSRGLVDDGTDDLIVDGDTTMRHGAMPSTALTGDSNSIARPGHYVYSGSNVQATLPSAASFPGGIFVFGPKIVANKASGGGTNIILSGTAVTDQGSNTASFFQQASGTFGGTGSSRGRFLTTANSGSVGLMSDGTMWCVMFSSGSLTFA